MTGDAERSGELLLFQQARLTSATLGISCENGFGRRQLRLTGRDDRKPVDPDGGRPNGVGMLLPNQLARRRPPRLQRDRRSSARSGTDRAVQRNGERETRGAESDAGERAADHHS